ncbi:MAG TPA: helical backbone metal receptor, partial [Oscillatoriaceae cyanobacterium]
PLRIVSVGPDLTEMLYALGLGNCIVGVDSYSDYPPAARQKPHVGGAVDLSDEAVIAARPSLIVSVEGDRAHLDRLGRLTGARVAVLETHHVRDIWANLKELGALTGAHARAETLTHTLETQLAAHTAHGTRHPSVFYMVWDKPLMTAGGDSYLDDLIALAGGRNIAHGAKGAYPPYSWEAVLAADPDVILGPRTLAASLDALKQRYPFLRAVRSGHVRTLPDDLISRPGPRVVQALEAVEAALR